MEIYSENLNNTDITQLIPILSVNSNTYGLTLKNSQYSSYPENSEGHLKLVSSPNNPFSFSNAQVTATFSLYGKFGTEHSIMFNISFYCLSDRLP